MKNTIYINTLKELEILKSEGINEKLNSFRTPGGRGIYWIDVELSSEMRKTLEKKGICVW